MSEPQIGFRQRCSRGGQTWVYDRFGAMDSDNDESDGASDDSYRDLILEHALWDLKYISRLFGYEDIQ